MARVDLPPSRLRARKRRRRLIISGALALAVVLAFAAVVALARAPFLQITAVDVRGSQTVATSTIEARVHEVLAGRYLGLVPRDNVFVYPNRETVAALMRDFPSFKTVEIHAVDFHTLVLSVEERRPSAVWCPQAGPDPCNYLDEDGIAYAPAPQGSDTAYVAYQGARAGDAMPAQYLTPDSFRSLYALVGALSQSQRGNPVRQVRVDESGDVRAYFQNDFLLIFALGDAGGDVFERLGLALKSDPFKARSLSDFEYLDLRWGDKLYYKLK